MPGKERIRGGGPNPALSAARQKRRNFLNSPEAAAESRPDGPVPGHNEYYVWSRERREDL